MAELTSAQQSFIDRYAPYANLASQQTGLPSRVILGKLAIESNWGQNMYGNNIAGLKTGAAGQNQGSVGSGNVATFEDTPGGRTNISDNFLRYSTPEQGIGGFVNWITNSGVPSINSLADRSGGGIFGPNATADQSAINALNTSGYSTDKNLGTTLPQRVAMIPDLSSYGIAASFDPTINRLAQASPYSSGGANVSQGAGNLSSNNYWSRAGWDNSNNNSSDTTLYQPNGQVLPREKNASGIALPSPQIATTPQALSALDQISNGLTGTLRDGANLIGNQFVNALGRLPSAQEFQSRVDALKGGASGIFDQLAGIGTSDEAKQFAQKTGIDPSQYVVNDAYQLATGRNADAASLPAQMAVLNNQGAGSLLQQLANSQEGQSYALNNFYGSAFGRSIDPGGLQSNLSALQGGTSLQDLERSLLGSPEAQARGLTQADVPNFLTPDFSKPQSFNLGQGSSVGTLDPVTPQNPIHTPSPISGDFNLPQLPGTSTTGGLPSTTVGTQGPGTTVGTQGQGTTVGTQGAFNTADPIGSLYQAILQRPGDASGIQSFNAQLNAGKMDLNQIVQALAGSDEAKALGPTAAQNAPTFSAADTVYARDFGRLADTAGAQNFDAQINAGLPQNILEAQLLGSQEAQNRGPDQLAQLVNNYNTSYGIDTGSAARLVPYAQEFQQATGRAMDVPTQQVWASQLNAGASPAILEAGLLGAPEAIQARTGSLDDLTNQFKAKYGLTPEQVNTLAPAASEFQQTLGRPVDVPTLQNWASQNTILPLLQAQILGSQEAQARGPDALAPLIQNYQSTYGFNPTQALTTLSPLASEFQQALGRAPDVPTLQTWANASAQGQGLGQLTAGLLQAPEVQARTGGQGTLFQQFGAQYGMNPTDYLTSLQPKAPAYVAPGISDPFGFSSLDTSGYNPNTGGGFGPTDGTISAPGIQSLPGSGGDGGSAFVGSGASGDVFASFNPQDSENNFLNSQMLAHAQQQAAGQAPEATNSNIWNANLNAMGQQMQAQQAAQNRTNMANMGMLGPAGGGFSNVGTYVAPGSYNYTPQGLFGAPTLFNAPSLGGMFGGSSMGTGSFR